MRPRVPLFIATVAAAVLLSCGDDGDDPAFFEVETANDAAHAAMLAPSDLPGNGWEITARDDLGDTSDSVEAARNEPACAAFAEIQALKEPGSLFGKDDAEGRVGHAQIELTRADSSRALPTTASLEVEILPTVSEVEEDWKPIKDAFASGNLVDCMAKLALAEFRSDEAYEGIDLRLVPATALADPPQDGESAALTLSFAIPGVPPIEMQLETYYWFYANAKNAVQIAGMKDAVTKSLVEDILEAADSKVVQAAKDY
jgi:hypothetical protein